MKVILGEKLKSLRVKNGMSQEMLAEKAGVSLRAVQRFEKSETKPRGDTLLGYSRFLTKVPRKFMVWIRREIEII